jgi:hypothetical protein
MKTGIGVVRVVMAGLLAAGSLGAAGAQTLSEAGNGSGTLHMLRVSIAQVPGENVKLQTTPIHKFTCAKPAPSAPMRACETALAEGQVVELRASHAPASAPPAAGAVGSAVTGKQWGGDCQNAAGAACTLTMSADRQVTIDVSKAP